VIVARVVRRLPLRYRAGAAAALDRPAHVRAASGLTWLGTRLIVVCDDTLAFGAIDVATGLVDDALLPPGPGGARTFDVRRGNKADKPDLEAVCAIGQVAIALGSGGPLPARQVIALWEPPAPPTLHACPRLFAALAAHLLPAGGALNLEGLERLGTRVVLGNRGGDTFAGGVTPDALVAVPAAALLAAARGDDPSLLALGPVEPLELGQLAGAPLRLTELAKRPPGRLCYLAAAERTTSFFDDGAVVGSVLGMLGAGGPSGSLTRPDEGPRHAPVLDEHGAPLATKLEGLAFDRLDPHRAYAVDDADDPDAPATLYELAISEALPDTVLDG
jgi:hypothetical protein